MAADTRLEIEPLRVAEVPRLALSEAEAARALSVSPAWLRAAALRGEIPSVKIGGRRLYSTDALRARLAEQTQQPATDGGVTL